LKNCEPGLENAAFSFSRSGNFCSHFIFSLRAELNYNKDTCNSKNSEVTFPPNFMLFKKEEKQDHQATIMYYPPNVHIAFQALCVARKRVYLASYE